MSFKNVNKRVLIAYCIMGLAYIAGAFICPVHAEGESFGLWSLMPMIVLFGFILLSKRVIEGFFWGSMLTVVMMTRGGFMAGYVDSLFTQITDWDNWWVLYLFLLGGAITYLFKLSGAGTYFARWVATKIKSQKAAMIVVWILGFPLSVDDYMSALVLGSVFTPLLDEYKVPREMTVYIIRSCATPPACFLPIGAWGIYVGGVMAMHKLDIIADYSSGFSYYLSNVLPYLFFPFTCMLVCLLVILGVIPKFGKMKKAFERVENGGPYAPPTEKRVVDGQVEEDEVEEVPEPRSKVNMSHFLVPVAAIFIFGYIFEWDMAYGITWGILASFVYYFITGVFDTTDCLNTVTQGFAYMSEMCCLMAMGLILCNNLGDMGFVEVVVGALENFISAAWLPLIIFVMFSLTEILVTFNYTLYLLAMPIVVQLAQTSGANVPMSIAALVSAGVVGYMLAFSSDGGILACGAAGKTDLYEQNLAHYPYQVIAWVLAAVLYGVFGVIMH